MSVRKDRQNTIVRLIAAEPISTQDELIQKLKEHGFETTQATISRDIKELKLVKRVGEGGKSVYSVSQNEKELHQSQRTSILSGAILSTDYAQNICVVRTHAGMANAACASIDAMNWDGIVGTLAGDDTIFLCCRTEDLAKHYSETLVNMTGE